MSFEQWKRSLRIALDALPEDEKDAILEYYKEMYADMADSGKTEEEIISELGSPEECARRTIEEGEYVSSNGVTPDTVLNSEGGSVKKGRFSVGGAIGVFIFSLIIMLPLFAAALSVVLSLGAVSVSGVVISFGGALVLLASPVTFFVSYSLGEILMIYGGGIAMVGIGGVIAIAFWYATKYSAKGVSAFFKMIYKR